MAVIPDTSQCPEVFQTLYFSNLIWICLKRFKTVDTVQNCSHFNCNRQPSEKDLA